jgi:monofunctional biosynthetic peptidoglycan transglycosylase
LFGVLLTTLPVLALRWIDPPTSAFMLREQFATAGKAQAANTLRHQWVSWPQISPHAKLAVVASEDQTFLVHHGFDLKSINEALEDRERGRRVRGASTISQQVAKNLFLWPGQSWIRKGLEAYLTVLIETLWPKRRILEVYLNIAEFGTGVYGVGAASAAYFRNPAVQLNQYDAALLAAVLPSPKRLRVDAPSEYVRSRQQWIVTQMRMLGGTRALDGIEGE